MRTTTAGGIGRVHLFFVNVFAVIVNLSHFLHFHRRLINVSLPLVNFKVGFYLKAIFWLGVMVLTQISRSRFKQSRISPLIPHVYVLGCFVNYLVFWGVYLERESFSQRISKIF